MTDHTPNTPTEPAKGLVQVEVNADRQPVVFARDGEVFASSRDVATYFAKEHRVVLLAIDNLVKQEPDLALHNFMQGSYTTISTGEQAHRCYDMDRRGFTLLAMGFTGKKALRWKLRYIDAFEAMEAELSRPRPMLDYSDPKVIMGVIGHLQEEVAKKDEVIAEQGTRLKRLDRIEAAAGSVCLRDAAKTLGVRPHDLNVFMSTRRWIYKRPGNKSWIGYQDKIQAGYLEHAEHLYYDGEGRERVSTRALVTASGMIKLAALLEAPLH